jgi:hypothetical protein
LGESIAFQNKIWTVLRARNTFGATLTLRNIAAAQVVSPHEKRGVPKNAPKGSRVAAA